MVERMKKCACCKKELPESEYTINRSMKDGLQIQCKSCTKINNVNLNAKRSEFARNHINTPHDIGVYCFKDGGEIIYIGSSDNLPFRIYKHTQLNGTFDDGLNKLQRKMRYRWHVLWHGDKLEDATHQEKLLIQIHQPKFNKIKYLSYEK